METYRSAGGEQEEPGAETRSRSRSPGLYESEEEAKETLVYFTRENFILPVNERTIMMKKEKEKQAQEYKRKIERLEEEKQIEERKNQELREREAQEKFRLEARKKLVERRRQEEQEELRQMNGEFGLLYQNFLSGRGLKEVFLSCMSLRPAQFRLLFKALEFNRGIKTLSINRKDMDDDEMDCLGEALENNQSLEVLQVEDNKLGPLSLGFLANVLSKNATLSSLSLEGNNLTRRKHRPVALSPADPPERYDASEFETFADALAGNSRLVYLNLANCNLAPQCGEILLEAVRRNDTLIMVDLSRNPRLDSRDLVQIHAKLRRNFKRYKLERLKEYQERKYMRENYRSKREREQVLKENRETADKIRARVQMKQEQRERKYLEEKEKLRREKEIQIKKLDKDARIRGMKKKWRKKKKPR